MIDLQLDADEEMIRDTARAFAQERLVPAMRVHERQGGVGVELVRAYRALGFAGMEAPATAGGQDASPLAKALVLEELGAGDAGAAFALEGAGPALQALVELGETTLLRRVLDHPDLRIGFISDGEGRLTLDSRTVTGTHPWSPVPASGCAAVVVVQGERMALVRDGVALARVAPCGLAAAGACQLDFTGAPVVAMTSDRDAVARAKAHARRFAAALLVGLARVATEYAMRYAQDRVAFGRPIAHHQGLAFLLADMATAVEGARLALWRAAAGRDDDGGARAAAWALAEAAEQALFVGPSAVQVLGGHGFMKDHPVEKWMRDIRTLALLDGGRDAAELEAAAAEI